MLSVLRDLGSLQLSDPPDYPHGPIWQSEFQPSQLHSRQRDGGRIKRKGANGTSQFKKYC